MLIATELSKTYGKEQVLRRVSFRLPERETLCLLGRSGGGKTTLLKCLAGLEPPDAGQVFWGEEELTRVAPNRRDLLYLYQDPLLFPHLNVRENIAFGLRVRGAKPALIRREVEAYLEELGLADQGKKYPHQLSGGQKQRVNFGRALILNPRVLLLDEPFGKLDAQTRSSMQALFRKIADRHRITSLFVTHEVKEALLMGTRFGRLEQGALTLYPDRSAFVADPRNGVQAEMDFWEKLRKNDPRNL